MRKFTRREVIIFLICVAMAGIYLINAFIVRPAAEQKDLIDQKIELASMRLLKDKSIIDQKDLVDQKYAQLLDRFGQAGSDATEGSKMLTSIQNLANQAGVDIANIQTQRVAIKESYKQFTVQLVIDAPWSAILDFIYQLQKDPYYFIIEELTLENAMDGNTSLRGQLTVNSLRFSPSL